MTETIIPMTCASPLRTYVFDRLIPGMRSGKVVAQDIGPRTPDITESD